MWMLPLSTSRAKRMAQARFAGEDAGAQAVARVVGQRDRLRRCRCTRVTATAGPNSSSQLIRIVGATSATSVGSCIVPCRPPPVTSRAPPTTRLADPFLDPLGIGLANHRAHLAFCSSSWIAGRRCAATFGLSTSSKSS